MDRSGSVVASRGRNLGEVANGRLKFQIPAEISNGSP
jgi:hypothetical protein